MTEAMKGYDTVVVCTPANDFTLSVLEPAVLQAAVNAGLERFVPNEFGTHTRGVGVGDGILFDNKKTLQEKIFKFGIGWTFFYNGGIFDYFLPNLRFFDKITTFGNMEVPIYTHDIEDIGRIAALAITDDRTLNRCVQVDFNCLTQNEVLDMLKRCWPTYEFEYTHYSEEYITRMKDEVGDSVTGKKGSETYKKRWGINYVIYVLGKLASFTRETIRASELYLDVICKDPETAICSKDFVFEAESF